MEQARNCIKCGESQQRFAIADVHVDLCPACGGLWLDEDAIRGLARDADAALAKIAEIEESAAEANAEARQKRPSTAPPDRVDVPCPACGAKLTIATLGATRVELCNGCHGIYLDPGELAKAMQLLGGSMKTTVVALARSVHTSGVIG